VCRCGDPTFNALGADVYGDTRWRFALDWERYDKEQAVSTDDPAGDAGRESLVETRITTVVSCTFADRLNLVARIPYSIRTLTEAPDATAGTAAEETATHGLSDPELYALIRVWSSAFAPGLGRRAWLSVLGGVKAPWGRNDLSQGGERLDEHAQPGTGSTDLLSGLSAVLLVTPASTFLTSIQYRAMGTNEHGYRYGDLLLANAGYEYKLSARLDGVLELNFRHAPEDGIDSTGATDPNTGGDALYLSPRLIAAVGKGMAVRATAQVPVARHLNGDQTERAVVNLGLTYQLQ
jgi:hypothetical protein